MIHEKKCSGPCGLTLPADAFQPDPDAATGLRSQCRACVAASKRKGREEKRNPPPEPDHAVLAAMAPFGTAYQRGLVEAIGETGSVAAAADLMGISPRQLRGHLNELERRAASRGWSPASDMQKTTPEGYHVKGVSTYYGAKKDASGEVLRNPDGTAVMEPRGQWVKTNKDADDRYAALLEAVQGIAEPFRGVADPTPAPLWTADDVLCVYPMGDPHVGMYAWARETGQSFDLALAEANLVAAVDHLVSLAPPSEEALLINLGDFYHSDTADNRTARSGNALDVDTRWSKVLEVGIRIMRRLIEKTLEKHARVHVINEIGNHDDHSAQMLALCLAAFFHREHRVTIDTSPAKYHWYRFGQNLIGVTHGDTVKPDKLGPIMATDRARDWGETDYRYWYTGHVHHDSLKEYPGCTVETFRTLAPADAWHKAAGYRSGQDMKLDVLHRRYGRVNRHVVGIRQVWAATGAVERPA